MNLDKRTLSLLAIVVIIIIAACFIFLAPGGTTTGSKCSQDSDCVLKKVPYCCGEKVEYRDACYYAGKTPPATMDCSNNTVCPKLIEVTGCRCENGACTAATPTPIETPKESTATIKPSKEPTKTPTATPTKMPTTVTGYEDSPFGLYGPGVLQGSSVGGWCPPSDISCGKPKPFVDCITDPEGPLMPDLCSGPVDIEIFNDLNAKWTNMAGTTANRYVPLDSSPIMGDGENVFAQYNHVQSIVREHPDVEFFTFGEETDKNGATAQKFAVYTRISYRALKDLGGNQKFLAGGGVGYKSYTIASYFDSYLKELEYMEEVEKEAQEYDGRYDFLSQEQAEFLFEEDDYDKYLDGLHVSIYSHYQSTDHIKTDSVRLNMEKNYRGITSLFGSYGYGDLILWISQTGTASGPYGWLVGDSPKNIMCKDCTEEKQANSVISIYVLSTYLGFERAFWAWVYDDWWPDYGWENYWGRSPLIYDGRGSYDLGARVKKLAYYTYKLMVEKLEGSDWDNIQETYAQDNVYAYKLLKNGEPIYVVWWEYFEEEGSGESKTIDIPLDISGKVKITEAIPAYKDGLELQNSRETYSDFFRVGGAEVIGGKISLTLGKSSVFIEETTQTLPSYIPFDGWEERKPSVCGDGSCDLNELTDCPQDCQNIETMGVCIKGNCKQIRGPGADQCTTGADCG